MNTKIHDFIEKHKQDVDFRTDRTQANFGSPQLTQASVRYEIAEPAEHFSFVF